MSQSEDELKLIEPDIDNLLSKFSHRFHCCICRREILKYESTTQCSSCQTYFHSNHLFLWLEYKKNCPICGCFFFQSNDPYPRLTRALRRGKLYRCNYCNHHWEVRSFGSPLWCPECGITSCPHCKTAFGYEFLLRQLQLNGVCPNCQNYISIDSLKAKIKVLDLNC